MRFQVNLVLLVALLSLGCATTGSDKTTATTLATLITTLNSAADQGQKVINTQVIPRAGSDYIIDHVDASDAFIIGYSFNASRCVTSEMLSQAFQNLGYRTNPKEVPSHRAYESYDTYEKRSSDRLVQVSADFGYEKQSWCISHLFINTRKS